MASMRFLLALGLMVIAAAGVMSTDAFRPAVIGAVFPLAGGQGAGGREEFRGVSLAAEYANRQGGLGGRPVRIRLERADSSDAAPFAVERLARAGITVIVGSHGSTISALAAEAAGRLGLVFWETGAVGELGMGTLAGDRVFRFAPTGAVLGRAAVAFARDQLFHRAGRAQRWRYAVTYVDDAYGRAVGRGAIEEINASGLPLAAVLPYSLEQVNYGELAGRIQRARADVLVVAAYLHDGVALRRAIVRAGVPLAASIGTSSSYCMPEFGQILGKDAVGLFASDKPDGDILRTDSLSPAAAEALRWARSVYSRRYGEPMSAPALSGFAGGVALFRHVLPRAGDLAPQRVARAAREAKLPAGALPNGSGLDFGQAGDPDASANSQAAGVMWEWVRPYTRAVVWPPAFATHAIVFPH